MVCSNSSGSTRSKELLVDEHKMHMIYQSFKANVFLSELSLSVVLLKLNSYPLSLKEAVEKHITQFLQLKIRDSKSLIQLSAQSEWCLFLPSSEEEEAMAFIKKIFNGKEITESMLFQSGYISFSVVIAKIGASPPPLDQILQSARELLSTEQATWSIQYINIFLEDSSNRQSTPEKAKWCTFFLKRYVHILESEIRGELSQERKEKLIAKLLADIHEVLESSILQQDMELFALYSEIVNKCR